MGSSLSHTYAHEVVTSSSHIISSHWWGSDKHTHMKLLHGILTLMGFLNCSHSSRPNRPPFKGLSHLNTTPHTFYPWPHEKQWSQHTQQNNSATHHTWQARINMNKNNLNFSLACAFSSDYWANIPPRAILYIENTALSYKPHTARGKNCRRGMVRVETSTIPTDQGPGICVC